MQSMHQTSCFCRCCFLKFSALSAGVGICLKISSKRPFLITFSPDLSSDVADKLLIKQDQTVDRKYIMARFRCEEIDLERRVHRACARLLLCSFWCHNSSSRVQMRLPKIAGMKLFQCSITHELGIGSMSSRPVCCRACRDRNAPMHHQQLPARSNNIVSVLTRGDNHSSFPKTASQLTILSEALMTSFRGFSRKYRMSR